MKNSFDLSKKYNYKDFKMLVSYNNQNKNRIKNIYSNNSSNNNCNIADCKKLPLVASVNTVGISSYSLPKNLTQQEKIKLLFKDKYMGTHRIIQDNNVNERKKIGRKKLKNPQESLSKKSQSVSFQNYQFFSSPQLKQKLNFQRINLISNQQQSQLQGQNQRNHIRQRRYFSKNYKPVQRRPQVIIIYNTKDQIKQSQTRLGNLKYQLVNVPKANWIDKMKVNSKSKSIGNQRYFLSVDGVFLNQKQRAQQQQRNSASRSSQNCNNYNKQQSLRKMISNSKSRYIDYTNDKSQDSPKKRLSLRKFQRKNLENKALIRIIHRNVKNQHEKSQQLKRKCLQNKLNRNQSPIRKAYSIIMNAKRKSKSNFYHNSNNQKGQIKSSFSQSLYQSHNNNNNTQTKQFIKTVRQNSNNMDINTNGNIKNRFQDNNNQVIMMKFYATQYASKKQQQQKRKQMGGLFDPKKWKIQNQHHNNKRLISHNKNNNYLENNKIFPTYSKNTNKDIRKGSIDLGKLKIDPW